MIAADVTLHLAPDAAAESDLDVVRGHLREFNRAAVPEFWAQLDTPEGRRRPLHVIARAADGSVVGGLIASTCLAWCDIDILSVRPDDRRSGVGRALMRAAEDAARARGCRYISVDTLEYQAVPFYERLGYAVVGRFADRTGLGHAKVYFVQYLDDARPDVPFGGPQRPPPHLVRFAPEHVDLAVRALRDVHGKSSVDADATARFLAAPTTLWVAAIDADDVVVGGAFGHVLPSTHLATPHALLYELDVAPSHRRRGIGTALVRAFVDAARATGASGAWLLTGAGNRAAMETYGRCGFRRVHHDDVMLHRDL